MTIKLPCHDYTPERAEELCGWSNFFALWVLCGKAACRRAHSCRGDARRCFPRHMALVPQGVRDWFGGLAQAQQDGLTFDHAMEELDATDAGDALRDWYGAVGISLGEPASLPPRWWEAR